MECKNRLYQARDYQYADKSDILVTKRGKIYRSKPASPGEAEQDKVEVSSVRLNVGKEQRYVS